MLETQKQGMMSMQHDKSGTVKLFSVLCLLGVFFSLISSGLQAREIRLAVSGEMVPFFYVNDDLQWEGMSIEVAGIVLKKLGHSISVIRDFPMNRIERLMQNDRVDLHPNWTPTPNRRQVAVFTTIPHVYEAHNFISRTGDTIPYDGSLESVSGFRIAAMDGWTHGDAFDDNNELTKFFMDNVEAQVRVLIEGRTQLAVQNPQTFLFAASNAGYNLELFTLLEPPVANMPVYMGISKNVENATELRDSIDKVMDEFIKTRAYENLLVKYGFLP